MFDFVSERTKSFYLQIRVVIGALRQNIHHQNILVGRGKDRDKFPLTNILLKESVSTRRPFGWGGFSLQTVWQVWLGESGRSPGAKKVFGGSCRDSVDLSPDPPKGFDWTESKLDFTGMVLLGLLFDLTRVNKLSF